jgi:hypothetical protein
MNKSYLFQIYSKMETLISWFNAEYEKVKNDPLRLQLFNVEKRIFLNKLQNSSKEQLNNNPELIPPKLPTVQTNTICLNPDPKCAQNICPPPNKINHMNLSGTKVHKIPLITVSGNKGPPENCPTKYVNFEMIEPDGWMFRYNIRRIVPVNGQGFSSFELDISSVPTEHIVLNNERYYVNIYVNSKIWKMVIIMFTPGLETVLGFVIRSCAVTSQ